VPPSDANRFARKADECRRLAAQAGSEIDKRAWLRLAAEWDKLADDAAQGRGIFERYK